MLKQMSLLLVGVLLTSAVADDSSPGKPRPTSAADSLSQIHIRDGFEVRLVASEPLVMDPVAIDWGLDGALWVVEMADYPLGVDGDGKPGGRVRVIRDIDADGQYDQSTLFAEGLSFPNGILVWGDGVLVTAAPHILYLEDSDGNGRADVRQILYEGFLEGNQQLRVNGLRWGLDNWVHCASGSHVSSYGKDSRITSKITGEEHPIGSRDFRIRPQSGEIDPQSGPSQYGRNRDDWGNWFGVQNSRPLWHYVLADHYIRRNRHFAPPDPKKPVVTPVNPRVYPAKSPQKRFHSFRQSGRFTSACSGMVYRDDLLFRRVDGEQHAFTCEPFHNLVQHNVIFRDGVSFRFRRDPAEANYDFFASRDRWCRPVMARTGPDGALWVVDMYRYMIEHPQWLPAHGQDELRPYFRFGEDQGRIYRIVPTDSQSRRIPKLHQSSAVELVALLECSGGWQRDVIQRRLIETRDPSTVAPLERMAASGNTPLARLHALCTLDGMNAVTSGVLQETLCDESAGVRRHAVRIAATGPADVHTLAKMVADLDPGVRLELAATLGTYDEPVAAGALAKIASESADDRYLVANVMSSLNRQNIANVVTSYIDEISALSHVREQQSQVLVQLFRQVAVLGDAATVGHFLRLMSVSEGKNQDDWRYSGLASLLDGISSRESLDGFISEEQRRLVHRAIRPARTVIAKTSGELSPQIAGAVRLLLRDPEEYARDLQRLADLLVPRSVVELQLLVVDRLSEQADPEIADLLLKRWPSYGPGLRARILDVIAGRNIWSRRLLTGVTTGAVAAAEIAPVMRERLLSTKDEALQTKWKIVFNTAQSTDRSRVVEDYRSALELAGDQERGVVVFRKHCAACHRLAQVGHDVGPGLGSLTDRKPQSVLKAILDPNAAVETRYVNYVAVTKDGRSRNGLMATETGSSITLLSGESRKELILRAEIDELRAQGKSLMPEGMEKDLSPQDIADLITVIQSAGRPSDTVADE